MKTLESTKAHGRGAGSKLAKARAVGAIMLSEAAWSALVGGASR